MTISRHAFTAYALATAATPMKAAAPEAVNAHSVPSSISYAVLLICLGRSPSRHAIAGGRSSRATMDADQVRCPLDERIRIACGWTLSAIGLGVQTGSPPGLKAIY